LRKGYHAHGELLLTRSIPTAYSSCSPFFCPLSNYELPPNLGKCRVTATRPWWASSLAVYVFRRDLLPADRQIHLVIVARIELLRRTVLAAVKEAGDFVPGDHSHLDASRDVLDLEFAVHVGDGEIGMVKGPDAGVHPAMNVATN